MAKEKIATSLPKCASCKKDVGVEVGIAPFFVDASASTPGEKAKHEAFCPTCFVYVRSPREPQRFMPGMYVPVKCAKCGLTTVAIGSDACGQCGSRHVVMLPPVLGVS